LSDGFKNRMRPPYVLGDEPRVAPVLSIGRRRSGKILPLSAAPAADARRRD
jgi:hypothetical protein